MKTNNDEEFSDILFYSWLSPRHRMKVTVPLTATNDGLDLL